MCFGGGGNNDAKKALNWQKQQAADAERRELERQARLKEGVTVINNLFDGAPVMGEREAVFDWDAFNDAAAGVGTGGGGSSGGYDPVSGLVNFAAGRTPSNMTGSRSNRSNDPLSMIGTVMAPMTDNFGYGFPNAANGASGGRDGREDPFAGILPEGFTVRQTRRGFEVVGPDGRVYRPGDELRYMEEYDTGERTGGFGDTYYNTYRDATLNYYLPELDKQFGKARSNLTFDHARAGTLQSSMASENLADLVYQKTMNDAMVRSKADNATGQLRQNVAQQKSAALGQLYATEDPSIAANAATNSVRTLQNTTPEFSPLGQLFQNAVVGATGFASAYDDWRNWGSPPGGGGSSGRVVN